MRGLTLWQPWATLAALGIKQYETRSWGTTNYRGKILIHAAAKSPAAKADYQVLRTRLLRQDLDENLTLHQGCILAIATLDDCIQMTPAFIDQIDPVERTLGLWQPRRYAWKLSNVQALENPIPYKGKQGLWKLAPFPPELYQPAFLHAQQA